MIKFEMSEMKKFDDEMLEENYDFKLREWDESFESGVYKIEIGSRGLVEDVVKVEVVDGEHHLPRYSLFKPSGRPSWRAYAFCLSGNSPER